jgi:HD superfamily phosphodiesterase
MQKLELLRSKVSDMYRKHSPERSDWADWLYEHHIFLVAENAEVLSVRFGGSHDLVVAASLLHDIGDSVMKRFDPQHAGKSKEMATLILQDSGFTPEEIEIVVGDAIEYHGCKNGKFPQTIEGKVMTTADAMAHLKSDFYDRALSEMKKTETVEQIKRWALPKIERDFNDKIFFDEVRKEVEPDYKRVKSLFLNLG